VWCVACVGCRSCLVSCRKSWDPVIKSSRMKSPARTWRLAGFRLKWLNAFITRALAQCSRGLIRLVFDCMCGYKTEHCLHYIYMYSLKINAISPYHLSDWALGFLVMNYHDQDGGLVPAEACQSPEH